MKQREEMIRDIEEKMNTLPHQKQRAVFWLVDHMELLDLMLEGEPLSEETSNKFAQMALEKEDYIQLAIITYKQTKDRQKICHQSRDMV